MSKRSAIVSAILFLFLFCSVSEADVLLPGRYRRIETSTTNFSVKPSTGSANTIELEIEPQLSGRYGYSFSSLENASRKTIKSSEGDFDSEKENKVKGSFSFRKPKKGEVLRYRLSAWFVREGSHISRADRSTKYITVYNIDDTVYVFVEQAEN